MRLDRASRSATLGGNSGAFSWKYQSDSTSHRHVVWISQPVARTPATARVLDDDAALEQFADVTKRRIIRAFDELGIFRRGQATFEIGEHPIDDIVLPIIDRVVVDSLPELRLVKYRT